MTRIRNGIVAASAAAACSVALITGCQSAKVTPSGIEIIGDDGFMIRARGLEEALKLSIEHERELEKDPSKNLEDIEDWREIIAELIDAKTKDPTSTRSYVPTASQSHDMTASR